MLFFVSQFASEGKIDEGKEFLIAEGTVKVCSLHFSRYQAEIFSSKSSFGSMLSLVIIMGATEVHLLGYYTILFVSCHSDPCEWTQT